MAHTSSSPKKRTNLSLNSTLLEEARKLGINLSHSAEQGIAEAVKLRKKTLWLEGNKDAIDSSNEYVENHGLPLEKFRHF
ncbi:type II toxin-antitoxin system CcdA family antitoxin [Vibrio sp. JC009]|uniref:type II toxin-antitoxin system CcdA family antitoxin n=1 Tax=Vibrio sp. JC009 TaxID=2912314 RepID=UPI0023B0E585|nr:type II toxin-antitoxin system CcdA family antitoxin [Vibrio sp. JC009]WED20657.1 type II toxin-antitoxin system CcdA family antitoxin [Vibrio sp. JC009]